MKIRSFLIFILWAVFLGSVLSFPKQTDGWDIAFLILCPAVIVMFYRYKKV